MQRIDGVQPGEVCWAASDLGCGGALKLVAVVNRLPKTRSGTMFRRTRKSIADGQSWRVPATIDDPTFLDEIARSPAELGYPMHHKTRSHHTAADRRGVADNALPHGGHLRA
jgi:propionyl-CoA synthetase